MHWRIRAEIKRLRFFLFREKLRGVSIRAALLIHAPWVVACRLYQRFASLVNGRLLIHVLNGSRLRRFHAKNLHVLGNHFYVIVMPGVLHLLLPCLDLVTSQIRPVLIFNGARRWERRLLQSRYPGLCTFRLSAFPASFCSHGDVISLLLRNNTANFGIIDHDLFFFGSSIFQDLAFTEGECIAGLFRQINSKIQVEYRTTHYLFFHTSILRTIMDRYKVGARSYRYAPRRARRQLEKMGLRDGLYLKQYQKFFDTLTLLMALAFSEGYHARYIRWKPREHAYHIGATSGSLYRTKDLAELYIHLRFLERIPDNVIQKRSAHIRSEFGNSGQVAARLPDMPEIRRFRRRLDVLLARLDRPHPR